MLKLDFFRLWIGIFFGGMGDLCGLDGWGWLVCVLSWSWMDAEDGVVWLVCVCMGAAGKFVGGRVVGVRGRFDPGRNRRNHAVCGGIVRGLDHRGLAVSSSFIMGIYSDILIEILKSLGVRRITLDYIYGLHVPPTKTRR